VNQRQETGGVSGVYLTLIYAGSGGGVSPRRYTILFMIREESVTLFEYCHPLASGHQSYGSQRVKEAAVAAWICTSEDGVML